MYAKHVLTPTERRPNRLAYHRLPCERRPLILTTVHYRTSHMCRLFLDRFPRGFPGTLGAVPAPRGPPQAVAVLPPPVRRLLSACASPPRHRLVNVCVFVVTQQDAALELTALLVNNGAAATLVCCNLER